MTTKSTTSYFEDVQKFHQDVLQGPTWDEPNILEKRVDFLHEELEEFEIAMYGNDITGMADALADLIYVALGTADILNLPFDAIWGAVQRANMAKVAGPTKRGNKVDAMKPDGWVAPEQEIYNLIMEHQNATK